MIDEGTIAVYVNALNSIENGVKYHYVESDGVYTLFKNDMDAIFIETEPEVFFAYLSFLIFSKSIKGEDLKYL